MSIGYEWVGWKNKTFDSSSASPAVAASGGSSGSPGRSLEMIVEFDSVRNFSRIDIHTNNDFRRDVQVQFY